MKKLILFLSMFLVTLTLSVPKVQAQDKSYIMKPDIWYQETAFGSADTISNTDDKYSLEYFTNKAMPVKYNVSFHIDSISGAPNIAVSWQGKVFNTDTWTNLTTVTWYGKTADTTILYSENSTAKYYRYFRLYLDANATAQKSRLYNVKVKFWDR